MDNIKTLPTGIEFSGMDFANLVLVAGFKRGWGPDRRKAIGEGEAPYRGWWSDQSDVGAPGEGGAAAPTTQGSARSSAGFFAFGVLGVVFERSDLLYGVEFSLCDRRAQSFFVLDLPRAAGRIGQFPAANLRLAPRNPQNHRKTLRRILRNDAVNRVRFGWYTLANIGFLAWISYGLPYEDARCCTLFLHEEFFVLSPKQSV